MVVTQWRIVGAIPLERFVFYFAMDRAILHIHAYRSKRQVNLRQLYYIELAGEFIKYLTRVY